MEQMCFISFCRKGSLLTLVAAVLNNEIFFGSSAFCTFKTESLLRGIAKSTLMSCNFTETFCRLNLGLKIPRQLLFGVSSVGVSAMTFSVFVFTFSPVVTSVCSVTFCKFSPCSSSPLLSAPFGSILTSGSIVPSGSTVLSGSLSALSSVGRIC